MCNAQHSVPKLEERFSDDRHSVPVGVRLDRWPHGPICKLLKKLHVVRKIAEVDPDFAQVAQAGVLPPNANGLDLQDAADITVRHRFEDKSTVNVASAGGTSGAAAVVVSLGSNGFAGQPVDGGAALPAPAAGTDERDNSDQGASYTTRLRTDDLSGGCSDTGAGNFCDYDDLLLWLPRDVVLSRLIATGWLP